MNKGEAIDKIVVFLARSENRKNEHDLFEIASNLGISKELAEMCFNTMFHSRHYIDGPPTIKDPLVRITERGLSYAQELETEHYEETGKLLFSTYGKSLPLPEVCEILFQVHKNEDYRVVWTKETYKGKPENLGVAKEVLLQQKIVYQKYSNNGKVELTYLTPNLFQASSYIEAKQILNAEILNSNTKDEQDYFTADERNEISRKIDEALKGLNDLGLGQEILFEELQELKTISLNKKNWTQLLKGKLLDLLSKEVLNKQTAIGVYEIISQSIKADRLILP